MLIERKTDPIPEKREEIPDELHQVPTRWVNKRLEELGETWRVSPEFKDGGYEMPPLSKP
jgi:hypothetical protein